MSANIEQTINQIKLGKIIAIIRGNFSLEKLIEVGDALLASPVLTMEITLNTSNALEAISQMRERAGDNMLVGAGTVRTVEQAKAAIDAGAQFLVAPAFEPAVVELAHSEDILHLPGVLTPTEVEKAVAAGCRMLKLFPADTLGPKYLKALRAPLDDIDFVPTGGIGVNNLAAYVEAGAAAVGVGGSLVAGPQTTMAEIISTARALEAVWDQAQLND